MLELRQPVVDGLDWGVVGVAGCLLLISIVGAFLAFRYSSSNRRPVAREFNYLWRARTFTQVLSVGFALSQLLRLQVLWGPASVFKAGGYHPTTFCRVYIAATYGVFEPGVLLLALFACLYSLQGRESARHPNFYIVLFSAFFSLPAAAAQIVAALFTRIVDIPYSRNRLLNRLFASYTTSLPQHCTDPAAAPGNCAFCVFPLLSTFASAAFAGVYLLALWFVTQRIISAVINKALARRVRTLQLLTTAWLGISLATRGCTVLFQPFELGFEALRTSHVVATVALVLTLQYYLVLKPVWDSHAADRALKQLAKQGTGLEAPLFPFPSPSTGGGAASSGGGAASSVGLGRGPTELQPLDSCASAASRGRTGEEGNRV